MIFDILIDTVLTILMFVGCKTFITDYLKVRRRLGVNFMHLLCVICVGLAGFAGIYWALIMVDKYFITLHFIKLL